MEVAECSLHPGRKLPAGSQLGVGVMEKNCDASIATEILGLGLRMQESSVSGS